MRDPSAGGSVEVGIVLANNLANLSASILMPRRIRGGNQVIGTLNGNNRSEKRHGWFSAAHAPPMTAASSPGRALRVYTGS